MAKLLEMPKLSPTMTEGQLTIWHKKEGDPIAIDDLLAEVETDKATMEFRSFDKGTLLKLLVGTGANVLLGQPVAIIGDAGEDVSALVAKAGAASAAASAASAPAPAAANAPGPSAANASAPAAGSAPAAAAAASAGATAQSSAPAQARTANAPPAAQVAALRSDGRVKASPYVRKMARERDIDLGGVAGSGPNGRIVAQDLDAAKDNAKAASARASAPMGRSVVATTAGPDEVRPLSMMRKTIARRLTESKQQVPHFYLTIDVDAGRLSELRERSNADLAGGKKPKEGDPPPLKISINDLLIKACAIALVRVPECNATFTPEAIIVHHRVDISVAVAIPDGLVTPVVRNADGKSVIAIAQEVRDLAGRAKKKQLRPEEMTDGTFSISNLGMFGIDSFAAVINPPEGAILAVGRVREEPVVKDGGVVAGQRLAITLSCDHRVVDGAVGAAFLAELREILERPTQVLLY